MLQIVGNNCTTAQVYRRFGIQFDNPFMWTQIQYPSFAALVSNFSSINFNNIEVYRHRITDQGWFLLRDSYVLNIDGKVDVNYVHYKDIGTVIGSQKNDLLLENPKEYIIQKYKERLERWKKDETVFVLSAINSDKYTDEQLDHISEITTQRLVILARQTVHPKSELVEYIHSKHENAVSTIDSATEIIKRSRFLRSRVKDYTK